MKKKMTILLLLILLIVSSLQEPAYASVSSWAVEEIEMARTLGLVTESLEAKFKQDITRAEFSELVVRFANLLLPSPMKAEDVADNYMPFWDVDDKDVDVKIAYHLEIINGVGDGRFNPNGMITRQEMATMLKRAADLVVSEYETVAAESLERFVQSDEGRLTPSWAVDGVKMMIALGVMKGNGTNFALTDSTTCEQAVLLVYRLYNGLKTNGIPLFSVEEVKVIQEMEQYRKDYFTPVASEVSAFSIQPDIDGPYNPGQLNRTVIDNGLKAINYARYLAGLPYDVVAPDSMNQKAQYGPLVLAANNQFTHFPTNEVGMPSDIFNQGKGVTTTSNIGFGYGTDPMSLYNFNANCMKDSSDNNIDRVGHRRWILNPNLKEVGMGIVGNYSATMIFDTSRIPQIKPEYVLWPAEGLFPLDTDFFDAATPWSFSIGSTWNKPAYAIDDSSKISVKMTRLGDKKVWNFSTVGWSGGQYFNVELSGYGYGPAVIFKPDVDQYNSGDEFIVEVKNLRNTATNQNETVTYRVKFY